MRYFTADETRVTRGEWFLTRSFGIVYETFKVPADEATKDVWFEEAAGVGSAALFAPDNWLEFRTIDWSTGLYVQRIWFQVVDVPPNHYIARLDADGTIPARQQWRLKRKFGGITDAEVLKGATAADFGKPATVAPPGQGVVHLSALWKYGGPFVQIETFEDVLGDVPHFKNRVRMGNLGNTVDYPIYDEDNAATRFWGFAAGDNLSTPPSAGFSGIAIDQVRGTRLFNTDLEIYESANRVLTLTRDRGLEMLTGTGSLSEEPRYIGWYRAMEPTPTELVGYLEAHSFAGLDLVNLSSDAHFSGNSGVVGLHASEASPGPSAKHARVILLSDDNQGGPAITLNAQRVRVEAHLLPEDDLTFDLGNATHKWRAIYVDQLNATTIAGATLTGQEWEYPGLMTIDAHADTNTKLFIANEGAGRVDLEVDRNILLGGTVDGVDVSVLNSNHVSHVADDVAHHNPATAVVGGGMTVTTTQALSVNSSVVRTSRQINTTVALQGGGDLDANLTLSLLLRDPSGLSQDAEGLRIADSFAGNGLDITNKVMFVGAGAGILVGADTVAVNEDYNFTLTGEILFQTGGSVRANTDFQLSANLDFLGTATRTISAAGSLNIVPAGDLLLNPGGEDVLPGGSVQIDLGDYNRKWRTLFAAELYVETLVAQDVLATIGGRIMVAPTSTLLADMTASQTTIDVKHNAFADGAFVILQTAPAGIAQFEAMRVDSGPTTIAGGYRYTVARNRDGTGANSWLAGDAVVSLGSTVGRGYIDLTSTETIHNHFGPTITIYSRTSTSAWDAVNPVVTMGNLHSFVDYSGLAGEDFGFATGNDLTLDPSEGFSGLTADRSNGLRLFNTELAMYDGGTKVMNLDSTAGLVFLHDNGLIANDSRWLQWVTGFNADGTPRYAVGHVGLYTVAGTYSRLNLSVQRSATDLSLTGPPEIDIVVNDSTVGAAASHYSSMYITTSAIQFNADADTPFTDTMMTLLSKGGVGIRTTAPENSLHIVDDSTATNNTTGVTISRGVQAMLYCTSGCLRYVAIRWGLITVIAISLSWILHHLSAQLLPSRLTPSIVMLA